MSDSSLNDFSPQTRGQALQNAAVEAGGLPRILQICLNLHAHTFYSFNYKDYSPSMFAVEAKKAGLGVGGNCRL